jgi:hypothetical protein
MYMYVSLGMDGSTLFYDLSSTGWCDFSGPG